MSEVVEKVVTSGISDKFAEKALEYLNSAEAFVSKEVPVYIEELLSFKVVQHLIEYFNDFLITIPIALLFLVWVYYVIIKKDEDGKTEISKDFEFVGFTFLVGAITLIPLTVSVVKTDSLIKAYKAAKAPRVYLIDYLRK